MTKEEVLICDTAYLNREGLKSIVGKSPFFNAYFDASGYDELERLLNFKKFDIITLDYSIEGEFSTEAISLIQENDPRTKILVISSETSKRAIYDVLGRGINNYITKECHEQEIYKALDACSKNEKYFCNQILDIIIKKSLDDDAKPKFIELTQRENEIVKLLAEGKAAKEMSGILNISIHTIYTHRKNIMKKLNISSPVELITYAINKGIVQLK